MLDALDQIDLLWVISLGEMTKPQLQQAAYEAYGCMLTGIRGMGMHQAPEMSGLIRRTHEVTSHSRVLSGLIDPQIVPPSCALDRFVKLLE